MTPVLDVAMPRVMSVPAGVGSAGAEAVDLAALAGLELDPWQAMILEASLAERPDGSWAAFEVGLMVSRQNGKGALLEARELAGLFLLGERLLIHSAHQFDTSLEAFRRLLFLIESTPELDARVKRVSRSHGEEGIELASGQRIRFRTRTKGGGRGFSGDFVALDEAMILPESTLGALLPTLSARPNPQLWYTGSAVDQVVHDHGVVFARVRERGRAGDDPRLAWFEYAADAASPDDVSPGLAGDPAAWRDANPALGIRITEEFVDAEIRAMDPRTFAVERLGVGDWPSTDPGDGGVIDHREWSALTDLQSGIAGGLVLAFDVAPDRRWASVCAAGRREDGLVHVEVVARRPGTGWLVGRLEELRDRHDVSVVRCDAKSPAAVFAVEVGAETTSTREYVDACGVLFDLVEQKGLRHLGTDELLAAVRGAKTRPLGDAWAWSRKSSGVDITPLVAVTLAVHGLQRAPHVFAGSW